MMMITLQEITLEEQNQVTFKAAVASGLERAVKDEAGTRAMLLATASEHSDQAWLTGIYQDAAAAKASAAGQPGQAIAAAIDEAAVMAMPFSLTTELVAEKSAPIELDTDLQVNLVVVETTNDPENEYGRLATRAMAKAVESEPGTLAIYAGQDQQTDDLVVDKQIVFLDVARLVNRGGAHDQPLGE